MAIKTKLMLHQKVCLEFCLEKNELPYSGIFMDYGCGKSLVALAIIEVMRQVKERNFRKVLIVSTSLSIESTWCDEIKKHSDFRFCILKGTAKAKVNLLEYAVGKIDDPNRYMYPTESTKPLLFLINYESVKSIYGELCRAGFDAIFADECFIKGTLVDTPSGKRRIEDISVGDKVVNVIGVDEVVGISQKEVSVIVEVMFNNKKVYCSEHHLFFTERGWIEAHKLVIGDILYATAYGQQVVCQELRMVQERIFNSCYKKRYNSRFKENKLFLWEIVFSKMENETSRCEKKSLYGREKRKNIDRKEGVFSIWSTDDISYFGESEEYQSRKEFKYRDKEENIEQITGDKSQTACTRRKWKSIAESAQNAMGSVGERVESRICSTVKGGRIFEEEWVSNMLQNRYSSSNIKSSNRSRRIQSFIKEESGRKEGSSIVGFRVDGIKSYKSGSIEFNKLSGGRDTVALYDLQVKNHSSYSVEGVIVHNSTKIKTHDAERTMALYEVGKTVPYRYIMTGFPITENLAELYSQIKFLDLGATFGNSYYAFINRYFVRLGIKTIIKKRSIKQILDLIKPFCIRITNEVLKLPPALHKPIPVEMTDQQKELLLQLNDTFRLELGKVKIDTKYIFTLLSKSLQICDGFVQNIEYEKDEKGKNTNKIISSELEVVDTNKDEALVEVLNEIDTTKNKVVIWCAFLFSVSKLEMILRKLGILTLTLTGATEDSNKVVQIFQRSREYNVLICTQKKAAESVTLTSARYAIYYSNIWSNDARSNSEARIRRKGSEIHKSIIYIDLITKDSVEEKVYECLRKKKDLINELKAAFVEMRG